jgi:hypothetical protein
MNFRNLLPAPLLSAVCASLLLVASAPGAKETAKADAAKARSIKIGTAFPKGQYSALNALPDWGGVWTLNFVPPGGARERPALKGKYLQDYQAWQREAEANNGMAARVGSNCRPPGLPGIMSVGQYPIEFLFTPGRVTTHHEAWMQWRIIFTDGRPHPPMDEWEPTFYGHSIGRWEGDTLVVDTVGIKATVPLGQGMNHSDQLHIVERIHLANKNPDQLVVAMTVTDPLALEKPWTSTLTYQRSREWELVEFICAENDRNPVDESGHTQFK